MNRGRINYSHFMQRQYCKIIINVLSFYFNDIKTFVYRNRSFPFPLLNFTSVYSILRLLTYSSSMGLAPADKTNFRFRVFNVFFFILTSSERYSVYCALWLLLLVLFLNCCHYHYNCMVYFVLFSVENCFFRFSVSKNPFFSHGVRHFEKKCVYYIRYDLPRNQ